MSGKGSTGARVKVVIYHNKSKIPIVFDWDRKSKMAGKLVRYFNTAGWWDIFTMAKCFFGTNWKKVSKTPEERNFRETQQFNQMEKEEAHGKMEQGQISHSPARRH